jgi:hypothetical protein
MTNMKYRMRFTARDNEAMFSSPKFARMKNELPTPP